MDEKTRGFTLNDPPQKGSVRSAGQEPARRVPSTRQMAQALVKLIAGKEQIDQALSVLPNRINRDQLDRSLKEGMSNLINDIRTREGL